MKSKTNNVLNWQSLFLIILLTISASNLLGQNTINVSASDFSFAPKDINIFVGDTVRWTKVNGFHNVNGTSATFPSNPESFGNGLPSSLPWVYSHVFTISGFYNYQCDPHATLNMIGTVNVTCGPINLSTQITNVSCHGGSDGLINLTVNSGYSPFTFNWSNGSSSEDINSLAAGVYSVTVTDNYGCTGSMSYSISQPTALNAAITTNDPITYCRGNGPVLLESAPDPTVTKQWLKYGAPINNATGDNYLTNFSGNYRLQVTNGNGCTNLSNIIKVTKLALPPVPTVTALSSTQICVGDSVGLSCTTGQYTYGWVRRGQIVPGETNSVFYTKLGGGYKAFVTDVNGCSRKSNKIDVIRTIRPTASITPTTAQLPSPICDGDTILLTSSIVGSTGPYTRQWYRYLAALNGETNVTYTSTDFGGYSVRVTDSYGCTHQSARTIIAETCRLGNTEYTLSDNFHVVAYPNPFRNEVGLVLNNFSDEVVRIIIRDAFGKVIYESIVNPKFEYHINTSLFNTGMYLVELHQGKSSVRNKIFKVK